MKKIFLAAMPAVIALLVTSCGNQPASTEHPAMASKPAAPTGAEIYKTTCVACHQANGEGMPNTYPPLAKSDYLADKNAVIKQVLKGSSGAITVNGKEYNNTMPPQQLSDDDMAAVLTYVYSNFGNSGPAVTAADVKAVRAAL